LADKEISMKLLTTSAIALAAAVAAMPAAAQYGYTPPPQPPQVPNIPKPNEPAAQPEAQGPTIKISNQARKAIVDLQNAVKANDFANVPAKATAALAVAQTKEDKYIIGILQRQAALAAKDNAQLSAAIDTLVASAYLDGKKTSALYEDLGAKLYDTQQFDQAAAAFEKAVAIDPHNAEAYSLIGEARFSQGRKADAVAAFQRAIQESLTAGQKPQEALYKRAVGVAYDAQLPVATDLGRQWASAYPGPDSWRNAIAIYRNMNHPDVEGTLDLLRLMQATGSLNSVPDYDLFVSAAADQSNFVEAQAIIDQGIAAKVIDPASPVFRDTIAALKTKPKATSADLAEATKTAVSGMALLRIGDRYFGLGDYAKAAELYRTSIGKTGVDPNIANLHLGMALARSGDKAGAITAFSAVTGTRADIAKFWLLYVQSRS
jgi:tetratricopeptide (TPR) repeat protein